MTNLKDLLGRRLLFVTGKGGTGKSTIAASIAVLAAQRGLRTLLCEMDAKGSIARSLCVETPGFSPVLVRPNLSIMTMDTESSLREYLRIQLRLPFIMKLGPLAAMFDYVADAAPGVKEILSVGKLCYEVREDHFDLVIVDSEASGHIVSQISSPTVIRNLVPRGPLADQTRWMLNILESRSQCGVVVVSTPEELSVSETISLVNRLRNETKVNIAAVVLNRIEAPPIQSRDEETLKQLCELLKQEKKTISGLDALCQAIAVRQDQVESIRMLRESVTDLPFILIENVESGMGVISDVSQLLSEEIL